jgi:hypothetical protein
MAGEICGDGTGQNKDAGADDGTDAERHEVDWSEDAAQAGAAFVASLGQQKIERLGRQ